MVSGKALEKAFRKARILAAVVALATCEQALAHSWYPPWCCSDHDCRELIAARGETVRETEDGFRLWDGRFVGRDYVKPSPDAKFHMCEEQTTKAIVCFFVPQGQS